MKHIKGINEIIGGLGNMSFSFNELKEISFKSWVAGDTEGMRTGDDIDREEFEEWWKIEGVKNLMSLK